jgi:arginase family enzyme
MKWVDDIGLYLKPVPDDISSKSGDRALLGDYIDIHSSAGFPEIASGHLVILGIVDQSNEGDGLRGPDEIRKKLYRLYAHDISFNIADLGNIEAGDTPADTQYALQKVVSALIDKHISIVILGGSQELTFANYAAYEILETTVNIAVIDSKVDMGEFWDDLSAHNYLSKIVIHKPSYLFNLSALGFQSYLNHPETLELLDKLFFDAVRLGQISADLRITEPYLRQADIISVDMAAIRNDAAPGTGQPNGLNGEQICQMMRYAGLSDKTSSFGIYNYSPENDVHGQTALLIAEMIWCIMDGFGKRIKEFPLIHKKDFIEYKVHLNASDHELVFFKSQRSDKWWMKIPYAGGVQGQLGRHHIVPCSYADYTLACTGDVPDLWWRTYQKLG